MISVLIPIYNYNVTSLVTQLNDELVSLNIKAEIICIDDASADESIKNANKIALINQNCIYKELTANIGRSKIRNLLAEKASYDFLIFLDCDVLPLDNDFLKKYIKALKNYDLVYGGLKYPTHKKYNFSNLHYHYGKRREEKHDFLTAGFGIKKAVFSQVKFNESIESYGYEDVLFHKRVKELNFTTKKIENPVVHYGITEKNEDFIKKEEESLRTLKKLYSEKLITKKEVKLITYFSFLEKTGTKKLYKFLFKAFRKRLLKNLTSNNPSLKVFDFYRLGYFCEL